MVAVSLSGMTHIEPSHYLTSRIKLHSVTVDTEIQTTTPSQAPICQCCRMLVPYVENERLWARDVEVDVKVSYVRVEQSDVADDTRVTDTVTCCSWCAGEFVSELSSRVEAA